MTSNGKIFSRFKSLGYVSNEVPLVTRYIRRRKENLVVTSVGKAFHTYGCAHFALLSVSGQHPEDITTIAADFFHIYTAAGKNVYAWRRGSELKHEYVGHDSPVHLILPFGPNLLTVDEDSNLIVWDIKTEENVMKMEFENNRFEITAIMHPNTYINKILLGSEQGHLNLINIKSQSTIYTFKGWGSPVTVLVGTPALDVAAIGLKSGGIYLHNLKFDETVATFHQDWGPVCSLSFRTDSALMVSGTTNGRIITWDLEKRKVFSQLLNAHTAAVTGLQCLPSEALMLSSSPDNSLKLWIFDMADGGARLLRLREGHSAPPSYIRFHGANGQNLLSAGGDSCLRIFNTVTETFNKSLGRASYNRKASKRKGKISDDPLVMPPIVQFTSETTREKEWDNIAAIHIGTPVVTTWSYGKLKMGSLKLRHPRFKPQKDGSWIKASPTSICLTHCGNFVVIGYSSGHCDRFNIQSGLHRATYGDKAHKGAVRGISVDSLNQTVVTGGADGKLKWWHFTKQECLSSLNLESGVSFCKQHNESGMIAIGLEDCSVILVDETERTILRCFPGHIARLTDASFSPDGRWLITSAMDRLICTWDIPGGCLIDRFKAVPVCRTTGELSWWNDDDDSVYLTTFNLISQVDSACTSLSFSPTGELLATTHVDCLGVYLWQNRTLYTHVALRPLSNEEIPEVALPTGEKDQSAEELESDPSEEENVEQISDLATLSGLPSSRWLNLLNIETVRLRNRPKEPPRAAAPAPFFLPTVPALDVRFDLSATVSEAETPMGKDLLNTTPFGLLLKASAKTKDFNKVIEKLKNMGPTAINYEINGLSGNDIEAMNQYIEVTGAMLKSGRDLELANAYLGVFLKTHGASLVKTQKLRDALKNIHVVQDSAWSRLETKLFYNLTVIQTLKST